MGAKPKVKKIGGSFDTFSFSLREDNARVSPTYFEWTDGLEGDIGKTFVFGDKLEFGASLPGSEEYMVAILTEPRSLHPENYEYVENNYDLFHRVLTYDKELIDNIPNALFYQLGGSSIAFEDWGHYEKTKDVCMIVSEKNTTPGHKMRHRIVEELGDRIDFYGAGVGKPFERKFDILKDYKWCVVVESDHHPYYYSEKRIDPASVGCIVLHWSPGQYHKWNPSYPYVFFNSISDLEDILDFPRPQVTPITIFNLEIAKKYAIAEDWIYNRYPELFT